MRHLQSADESRFWDRLAELSRSRTPWGDKKPIRHLMDSVSQIADRAKWITTQICRCMPQYTLHEERHFLNVLAIMEALVPDAVMDRLSPLECGLPILAAYTHDLGMALSSKEYDALHDESTELGKHFQSYRSRYDEELRQIERWREQHDALTGKGDEEAKHEAALCGKRFESIEGHILSSYIRDTHTEDDQIRRLCGWLEEIRKDCGDQRLFYYGEFPYQRILALIGLSHGRGRRGCEGNSSNRARRIGLSNRWGWTDGRTWLFLACCSGWPT